MNSTTKNIVIVLLLLSVAFAGYFFYAQQATVDPNAEMEAQQMLANTEIFISRSQELDAMQFDLTVFEDKRFNTLSIFSKPLEDQPVGKTNPFSGTGVGDYSDSSTE